MCTQGEHQHHTGRRILRWVLHHTLHYIHYRTLFAPFICSLFAALHKNYSDTLQLDISSFTLYLKQHAAMSKHSDYLSCCRKKELQWSIKKNPMQLSGTLFFSSALPNRSGVLCQKSRWKPNDNKNYDFFYTKLIKLLHNFVFLDKLLLCHYCKKENQWFLLLIANLLTVNNSLLFKKIKWFQKQNKTKKEKKNPHTLSWAFFLK